MFSLDKDGNTFSLDKDGNTFSLDKDGNRKDGKENSLDLCGYRSYSTVILPLMKS